MIILSYQGPNFSDVRAVKLADGLNADDYIAGLPEASCAIKLNSADDVTFSWSISSRLYKELAQDKTDRDKKFKSELEAQDALYALVARVAKTLDAMPKSEAGKAAKDDEKAPRAEGSGEAKPKKEKPPKIEDKWSKMDVNEMAKAAKKLGYKEVPAPNGGVRSMRLRNWLRKNGK